MDPFSAPYRFELEPPPPNPYASDLVVARPGREPSDVDPNESVMSLLQQAESRFLEEREEALARGRQEASAEIERAEKARQEAVERADAAEMTLSALGDIEARVSQLLAEARSEADRAVTEAERLASLQQEAAQRIAEDRVGELLGEAQGHATELMHMAEREARRLRKEGIARDLQFVDEIETELNEVMFTQLSSLQTSRSVLDGRVNGWHTARQRTRFDGPDATDRVSRRGACGARYVAAVLRRPVRGAQRREPVDDLGSRCPTRTGAAG